MSFIKDPTLYCDQSGAIYECHSGLPFSEDMELEKSRQQLIEAFASIAFQQARRWPTWTVRYKVHEGREILRRQRAEDRKRHHGMTLQTIDNHQKLEKQKKIASQLATVTIAAAKDAAMQKQADAAQHQLTLHHRCSNGSKFKLSQPAKFRGMFKMSAPTPSAPPPSPSIIICEPDIDIADSEDVDVSPV